MSCPVCAYRRIVEERSDWVCRHCWFLARMTVVIYGTAIIAAVILAVAWILDLPA